MLIRFCKYMKCIIIDDGQILISSRLYICKVISILKIIKIKCDELIVNFIEYIKSVYLLSDQFID